LNLARPDIVRNVHTNYLDAGADLIETNSFGGSPPTLNEFDLAHKAREINRLAAEIACEAAAPFAKTRPIFVLGSMGPGTRLPSLGQTDWDSLHDAYATQAAGLIEGGADALLIETCQDPLQIKAAVAGARTAGDVPIFIQITIESSGTMLIGTDIEAAATILEALRPDMMGMNCATGPAEMAEPLGWLSRHWPSRISVQPNAGMPHLENGKTIYPLEPGELSRWHRRFVSELGVNMVGGCCGTVPAHIGAVNAMLTDMADPGCRRPKPNARKSVWIPAIASPFAAHAARQENGVLMIGERCNANGSARWRRLQEVRDWNGAVAMAREQEHEGVQALDISTAHLAQNEGADMIAVVERLRGDLTAVLVVDSTDPAVMEAALKRYGGKPILNSIHFEDGEKEAAAKLALAKRFGAAVIGLAIDENGMAKTADRKIAIAKRLIEFARTRFDMPLSDFYIDPLIFTIATGMKEDRASAIETLAAIRAIRTDYPDVQIILGLSNVSFGLPPAARAVVNTVFLDMAQREGATAAILHAGRIRPLHIIDPEDIRLTENALLDRHENGSDPLAELITRFTGVEATKTTTTSDRPDDPMKRLAWRVIQGVRDGLEDDLAAALAKSKPLDLINGPLMDGMGQVGEMFGAGLMPLPFVLRAAEIMKTAVGLLEPVMEKGEGQSKETLVLATVAGDVHDIGKNLVDIILTNNGVKVVNLGVKQPLVSILEAARVQNADAISMSGLLVKSAHVMRDSLAEMAARGIDIPVILGGAALTRRFVNEDCAKAYGGGPVAYSKDAFDGLRLMKLVANGGFDDYVKADRLKTAIGPKRAQVTASGVPPLSADDVRTSRREKNKSIAVPESPFLGARLIEDIPVDTLLPCLDRRSLARFHWDGVHRLDAEIDAEIKRLIDLCEPAGGLRAKGVYGYWLAAGTGDSICLFDTKNGTETARFDLPRQSTGARLCLADYLRDIDDPPRDVLAMQAVTMGNGIANFLADLFAQNRYRDYVLLHGLVVELAEAAAQLLHSRIRRELGIDANRGLRYAFGYPACPDLHMQARQLALLGADRIGLALTESDALVPEASTTALVFHNRVAEYFSIT
ncbi:MAG: methionine synthase, partial [Pseudomonadota bacterium]|nr:methionine synthase [Pseudomonadota bacterium]